MNRSFILLGRYRDRAPVPKAIYANMLGVWVSRPAQSEGKNPSAGSAGKVRVDGIQRGA